MRKPEWIFPKPASVTAAHEVRKLLRDLELSTVCESARCPNRGECFSGGTATFLILGETCTRRCGFCAIEEGTPAGPRHGEARAVAEAVRRLALDFVVVTSVTRDDLPDGGAAAFVEAIREIRSHRPGTILEALVPDFAGCPDPLHAVLKASPEVLSHNLETVPRLYPRVRPGARYGRSLELLRRAGKFSRELITKSGVMLGLGEEREEILEVMVDLAGAGCRCLTLGQYLQPTRRHLPVVRYLRPEEFEELRRAGRDMGISQILAGPLVRSSYRAREVYAELAAA